MHRIGENKYICFAPDVSREMHNGEVVHYTSSTGVLYCIGKLYFHWYLWVREFGASFLKLCFHAGNINMMGITKAVEQGSVCHVSSKGGWITPCRPAQTEIAL